MKKLTPFFLVSVIVLNACSTKHDIVIRNGLVYDGLGGAPSSLDIAIDQGKIVAIEDLSNTKGQIEIDATGLAIAPGFIDMHAHLDPLMRLPDSESHVRQGVTTALGGPDGSSPWPLDSYMDSLRKLQLGMNVAYLIGHNTVRKNVMNLDNRPPTEEELGQMKAQVAEAMEQGAFGISTGLKYLPGAFSKVDEVIALSKVAANHGGIYTSHLREEGLGLLEAVEEAIMISREANIPVVLTHHKAIGQPMWGSSKKTLAMVDSARNIGLDIMMDQYPYIASYTGISVLIPAWARAGGQEAFKERLLDPILRDSIKRGIEYNIINDRGGGDLNRIQLAKVDWQSELEGKKLYDWAVMRGLEPTVQVGAELVMEAQSNGGASCIYFAMSDEDVDRIMQHPQTMIASDGRLTQPGEGHPHPRWYGTFPRVLGHYVRERKLLSLESAIAKMTSLPAKRLGLTDRGWLAKDMAADIVIFDPQKVIDKATFENPHQYPEGIQYVLVNGVITVNEGIFSKERGGEVLMKK
ncbi:D-aminoacylase [Fulvivirgaceae bacterium BMA10]|uniref:D-aminoacylase n=1 Tax=Splendidivirga corallicola TaxID=3051826 RepID=A0ABT8KY18_9BACT|nr:D-aminoacylase [Fulvivirgaceae bacterium BMA10]